MANNGYTQQALAVDPHFKQRVKSQFSSVAWEVQNEDPTTANHNSRNAYARQVIRNLDSEVNVIIPSFVMRPNVFGFETSYDFQSGQVVSATGDADIASQLASDWDNMAAAAGYISIPPPPTV